MSVLPCILQYTSPVLLLSLPFVTIPILPMLPATACRAAKEGTPNLAMERGTAERFCMLSRACWRVFSSLARSECLTNSSKNSSVSNRMSVCCSRQKHPCVGFWDQDCPHFLGVPELCHLLQHVQVSAVGIYSSLTYFF